MRQRRDPAGRADRVDRLARTEPLPRHVPRSAARQDAAHGVVDALGVPRRHQRARDVGAPGRADLPPHHPGQMLVDRHAQLAKPFHDQLRAQRAQPALGGERRLERRVVRVHAVAEDVQLALPEPRHVAGDAVDLDPRQQARVLRALPGGPQLAVPVQRVVVGDRRQRDAPAAHRIQQPGRRQDAVGPRGVAVQVDAVAAGCRHARPAVAAIRVALRPDRRRVQRAGGHASTSRLSRSMWSARPVAVSTSIWTALNTTGPDPTSNRVGSPLRKRGRTVRGSNPITL